MTDIVLIGAGGHGKVVAETAQMMGYRAIAFIDAVYPRRTANGMWPIINDLENFEASKTPQFLSIGNNSTRSTLWTRLDIHESPVLSHPSSVISTSARLGPGTLLVAGSIVNAGTIIGRSAILNTGCSVDHDCILGDFVHISPGARLAGGVCVGDRSWIGIGAAVCGDISIGADVIVGAGAVVIDDIPDGATVVGVPARPLNKGF